MTSPLAPLFGLDGRVAVLTGGASGLGFAMAEVVGAAGAKLVLMDMDGEALEQAKARLFQAGCDVDTVQVDVADSAALRAAMDAVFAAHGRLDILFANAGVTGGSSSAKPEGALETIDPAVWDRVLGVNLTAVFNSVRFAAGHMKANGWGRVVVTSSVASFGGDPIAGYVYGAAKAGVNNLVKRMALELAADGITVNAIAPGIFLTNIAGGVLKRNPARQAELVKHVPLDRIGQPEDIQGLALLLASPAGAYITGAIIPIDGGQLAK